MRLPHAATGGVTTGAFLLGRRGIGPARLLDKTSLGLSRTLKHVIDYSIRGQPVDPNHLRDANVYRESDRLHPLQFKKPLVFSSTFSATGFCMRELTPREIALAFDFPLWAVPCVALSLLAGSTEPLVPLKIVDAAWSSFVTQPTSAGVSVTSFPQGATHAAIATETTVGSTWLSALGRRLPHTWIDPALVTTKSVKADREGVPSQLWDLRISLVLPVTPSALLALRSFMLRVWRHNLLKSFLRYLRDRFGHGWLAKLLSARQNLARSRPSKAATGGGDGDSDGDDKLSVSELLRDAAVGVSAILQNCRTSWWEWTWGSSLLYWRWPTTPLIREARDGTPFFVLGKLPANHRAQRKPPLAYLPLVAEKIANVRDKGYIVSGLVRSLTTYFQVPKGAEDLRMVYDGTSSGLNRALWSPAFWLPTPDTALRQVTFYTYCVDIDLGEMFLNFPMDPRIQPYAGIDLSPLQGELQKLGQEVKTTWERWTRLFMGCKLCPYLSIRYTYHAEEFVVGDRLLAGNPMHWDHTVLNLPGMVSFNPALPWVYRWDNRSQRLAASICAFVDDFRIAGNSVENAWQVARQVASRLQYLGMQDAPRKRRPPSQNPGAWAGSVFRISSESVAKTVSQEKWDKAKAITQDLSRLLLQGPECGVVLNYKDLERKRGFLGHLCMTFRFIIPFMKGLHLTIDSWRPLRGRDGWKLPRDEWDSWYDFMLSEKMEGLSDSSSGINSSSHPEVVTAVPRLFDDVAALMTFFQPDHPPEVKVRLAKCLYVVYGFGDASGGGFGSSIQVRNGISYRMGVYGPDGEGVSSNYREFSNAILALEEEADTGSLKDTLVFFFTDNSTVEAALYKGSSTSSLLLELVIRFYTIQAKYGITIHVSHVAGKRMIAQGTDGLSRGQINEGVMGGDNMLNFIPLHLSAVEREPRLVDWVSSWLAEPLTVLTPTDWFERGQDIVGGKISSDGFWRPEIRAGAYLWVPPPAAADTALEQLRISRIKRQASTHVFICPRLMTPAWLKQLYKAADLIFVIPAGPSVWPEHMFEPLLIGVAFPFLSYAPWQLKGTPKMLSLGRQLSAVWKGEQMDEGHILRKFCNLRRRMEIMPRDVVRRMLFFQPQA